MASTPLSSDSKHGGHSHVLSVPLLLGNMLWLMFLLIVTWWASTQNFGNVIINNVVAMLIATVKAVFVIWIFMGVMHASKLAKIWVVTGFGVLFLMFGILGDYATRQYEPVSGWETNVPNNGGSAFPREWPPQKKPEQVGENFRPRG
ncbi:caa3_sub_IV, caa(3)-type oxidase, subunit IV [Fimbriimonadaceae bacterium]